MYDMYYDVVIVDGKHANESQQALFSGSARYITPHEIKSEAS